MIERASWIGAGPASGWALRGTVPASALPGVTWWARAVRVAVATLGTTVDVVTSHSQILRAGPFGANPMDGSLPRLLSRVPRSVLVEHLATLSRVSQIGLDREIGAFVVGLAPATERDVREAFALGGGGEVWEAEQRARSLAWVEGIAAVLRDPAGLRAVVDDGTHALRGIATALREPLGWTSLAGPPASAEFARGAAAGLALALVHPGGAGRLIRAVGPDAEALLSPPGPGWPLEFAAVAPRLRAALAAEGW